jgi:hypothetical protein
VHFAGVWRKHPWFTRGSVHFDETEPCPERKLPVDLSIANMKILLCRKLRFNISQFMLERDKIHADVLASQEFLLVPKRPVGARSDDTSAFPCPSYHIERDRPGGITYFQSPIDVKAYQDSFQFVLRDSLWHVKS